ncbi:MAG: ferrous iron transport protein B [Promethearchaeota archaeon]
MRDTSNELNHIKIALAGNPNVGKSVIFNTLTGLSQVIGNWPGKTVSKAEGKARFENYVFEIIDLPGIYSLSTYSLEEIISREFIINEKPDYIINVIDSNHLERNLFFTLQLLLLGRPVIVSLNQYDILTKQGYEIDIKKIEELLGVPVIPAIAVHNRGLHEVLEKIIEIEEDSLDYKAKQFKFGKEIDSRIEEIMNLFQKLYPSHPYTSRFAAIKLIENDESIIQTLQLGNGKTEEIQESNNILLEKSKELRNELEEIHGEQIYTVINSEFYNIANRITKDVEILKKTSSKQKWTEFLDYVTIHNVWGYLILAVMLFGMYSIIFTIGDWISGLIDGLVEIWEPGAISLLGGEESWVYIVLWKGLLGGMFSGIGGVLPFVFLFFLFIEILQDTGYLPRAAYLMDNFLHKIGVHGKTIIPMLLGFGCNVPAIMACRIMETEREKRRSILITSMIPCAAVATIIMGLVGKFIGLPYALLLYAVNFVAIIFIGKIMGKNEAFKESELIIELHDFRVPNFKVIAKQTFHRSKEFIFLALPLIMVLGGIMEILLAYDLLGPINSLLSPITYWFLGLPAAIGIYLLYGILRKELNLVLLELFVIGSGSTMIEYLTPIQMMVFCLVTMLYIPCMATLIVIQKEAGTKFALQILLGETILAILIAGIIRWLYVLNSLSAIPDLIAIILSFTEFFILMGIFIKIFNIIKTKAEKSKKLIKNK